MISTQLFTHWKSISKIFFTILHQKLSRTKRHRASQNKGPQQPTVASSQAYGPKHADEAYLQVAFFWWGCSQSLVRDYVNILAFQP